MAFLIEWLEKMCWWREQCFLCPLQAFHFFLLLCSVIVPYFRLRLNIVNHWNGIDIHGGCNKRPSIKAPAEQRCAGGVKKKAPALHKKAIKTDWPNHSNESIMLSFGWAKKRTWANIKGVWDTYNIPQVPKYDRAKKKLNQLFPIVSGLFGIFPHCLPLAPINGDITSSPISPSRMFQLSYL